MKAVSPKVGDRIRIQRYIMGHQTRFTEHTLEEFRFVLGIFLSQQDRTAEHFTPLCDLYTPGPQSKLKYIPNYGEYTTDMVPTWILL